MLRIDRVWQWAWDRHGPRYSWAVLWITYVLTVPIWVFSAIIMVELVESDRIIEGAVASAAITLVLACILVRPGFSVVAPDRAMGRRRTG